MLRSCYTTDMRLYQDSKQTVRVGYYFARADAPDLGYATPFASANYDDPKNDDPKQGELPQTHAWHGGQSPNPEPVWKGACYDSLKWDGWVSLADRPPVHCLSSASQSCCEVSNLGQSGGVAYGQLQEEQPIDTTCDIYRPFGAPGPLYSNVACALTSDLATGRGSSPINTVVWTHYIDLDQGADILDACTRTDAVDTINYADGDEVRIPSGGGTRYVVVWVTLCDCQGAAVKRAYLLRHSWG